MSKWLYDPEKDLRNGKEFTYNLPIHENDTLFNGFTYREIMDVIVANCGHNVTEAQFDKHFLSCYMYLKKIIFMRIASIGI